MALGGSAACVFPSPPSLSEAAGLRLLTVDILGAAAGVVSPPGLVPEPALASAGLLSGKAGVTWVGDTAELARAGVPSAL